MATFITRLDQAGGGLRLAVKDLIDVQGVPTTAGSKAVADRAIPALADAPCLAGARAAGAVIVGKTNLNELAYGASGLNQHFGTPVNPLDPDLLPGGSSSGSAVAVGAGEADVAYGSDTGGSIRVPAAYCGVAGLKTTHGRVPLDGVWPLAPSLDTVGPMARDVAGLVAGMALLEPGFAISADSAVTLGRVRATGEAQDPAIEAALDEALAGCGIGVAELELDGWGDALTAVYTIMAEEAAISDGTLMADPLSRAGLGSGVRDRLAQAAQVTAEDAEVARRFQREWKDTFDRLFQAAQLLVLPTVPFFPPPASNGGKEPHTRLTAPINLAGLPALALPVPAPGSRLPASLQLIGPAGSEELILATGAVLEAAAGYRRP
ncbi:MAG TPA: amidase [Streptosporangiaceae bacterium]|nr:amidase [Streptosporangiaceae bacterium]